MERKPNPITSHTAAQKPNISGKRKTVFSIILILIPLVLVLLFELSLHIVGYGYNLDLFVASETYPGYYEVNKNVAKRFFTKFNGTSPSNDIFLMQKPKNCYRIFAMGCSTMRGFPYEMNVTFSRILNDRLQDAFPDKKIEVVNTAMAAVNSYTQADFIDEILAAEPDAILIYTGHNEFYGALGVGSVENGGNTLWMKRLHLALIKYRTYQLVQSMVGKVMTLFVTDKTHPTGTLMERIVKDKAIPYKSGTYNDGIEQFKVNMGEVVKKITDAKVPLILSELVSNISGNPPFNSVKASGYATAAEVFKKARALEAEGKYTEAREQYYLAKDLDGIRFRAPEDINAAIRNIAATYNVAIFDMKKIFAQASPHGIIGNSLMTEHLHPNVDGYFLMADAFFNEMRYRHFISTTWDTTHLMDSKYYRSNWGFTALDSLVADLKIRSLKAGWPFMPDSVVNTFIYTYKPVSMVDSIALLCVKYDNVSIQDKHRDLASIYLAQGEKRKAVKEYYSLIKSYPYATGIYYEATKVLIELNDYPQALDIMLHTPNRDTIFFANLQLGKIYQSLKEHALAIKSFEHAKSIIKKDDNLEFLLISEYNSYEALHDSALMAQTVAEIRKINPQFSPGDAKKKEVVIYLDKEVRSLVQEALQLAKQQKYYDALALLEKSLKIKESPFALQMMGSILYQINDDRALAYLERAYQAEPGDLNTINNLFVVYLTNKDYKMASKMLAAYKALSPDFERVQKLTKVLEGEMSKQH